MCSIMHAAHGMAWRYGCIWPILRGHVRSWILLVLATEKSFPKGCHLFGGDGRQGGTATIADLQVLARRVPPLAYPTNSSHPR